MLRFKTNESMKLSDVVGREQHFDLMEFMLGTRPKV